MKHINLKSITAFLLILTVVSCKKEYEFPEITQEGKGTFGCRIDGKDYVPETYGAPFSPRIINTSLEQIEAGKYHYLVISVSNDKTNTFGHFKISYYGELKDLHTGTYGINDPSVIGGGFSSEIFRGDLHSYATADNTEGKVTILRFDKNSKIISGTFEFPMFNKESGERIEVTDGRFDLKIE